LATIISRHGSQSLLRPTLAGSIGTGDRLASADDPGPGIGALAGFENAGEPGAEIGALAGFETPFGSTSHLAANC
jgi:hypothetical protein